MAVDTDGASPLHYASVMSSNEVVTLLVTEVHVNTLYIHTYMYMYIVYNEVHYDSCVLIYTVC